MQGRVELKHPFGNLARAGDPLPPVSLPSTADREVDLRNEAAAQSVILFFYPGDGAGLQYPELSGCTAEACSFRDQISVLRSLGAAVFGVSLQPTGRQQEFVAREHLSFELLSDSEERLTEALGLPVWVSAQGERFVARTTVIARPGGTIAHVFAPVEVDGHVDAVVAALRNL